MNNMISIILAIIMAYYVNSVESAAIGEIARNVHSDLVNLETGFQPRNAQSGNIRQPIPAGTNKIRTGNFDH